MLFIFLYVLVNNTPNEVNMSLYISLYRSQRGYVFVHRAVFIDSTARWPFISKTLEHSHLYVYISSNNHVSCYRVTYIPGGWGVDKCLLASESKCPGFKSWLGHGVMSLGKTFIAIFLCRPGVVLTGCGLRKGIFGKHCCKSPNWKAKRKKIK